MRAFACSVCHPQLVSAVYRSCEEHFVVPYTVP
jgi:hypothetical protein